MIPFPAYYSPVSKVRGRTLVARILLLLCQLISRFQSTWHTALTMYGFYSAYYSPVSKAYPEGNHIPASVNPQAGAVGPALFLSFDSSMAGISPGFILPLPTSIKVPAIILTM